MYTKKEAELDLNLIKERLIDFEGMVLKPYHCSENYLTIGVGRNLESNGINEEEALYLLNNDVNTVIQRLDDNLPQWTSYPLKAQYVLVDMCFNMGWRTLSTFRKFLKALDEGDYLQAAEEIESSKYCSQVGRRCHFNAQEIRSLQE